MSTIDEIIEIADRLSNKLEKMSENEALFGIDIGIQLEKYSWEMHRMANEIKGIKEYCGI